MIETLTNTCYLFKTHKWRDCYQTSIYKRKAFWLICGIVSCVTVATYFLVIYHG